MNERIKELESQAWEQVNRTNGLVRTEDFNQKFAELLLLECLTVINQPNGVGDDDVIRISEDVKRHFGVI